MPYKHYTLPAPKNIQISGMHTHTVRTDPHAHYNTVVGRQNAIELKRYEFMILRIQITQNIMNV